LQSAILSSLNAPAVVACLLSAIGYGCDVGWDLAELGAVLCKALVCSRSASQSAIVPLQAHTHLPDELLHRLVHTIIAELELRGNPLGLVGESHAALGVGSEGALELDYLLRLRTDLGFGEEYGVAESDAWGADGPMLVFSEEAQDRVREVGCEDLEEKR
jgi:hypothetical protein